MALEPSLEGQVAIVTGAGKGLGRTYAQYLASRGAKVIVNNRRHPGEADAETSAQRCVQEIIAKGGTAVANYANVIDVDSGERMVEQALDTYGRLDIVIGNAGIDRARMFHKSTLDEFREVFDIGFLGNLHLAMAAWPVLRQRGYGRVVLTTSTAGLYGNPGQAPYSAAKGAVIGLVKVLAQEGSRLDLKVNAISPFAATPMTDKFLDDQQRALMDPAWVAPAVGWLAGPECTESGEVFVVGLGVVRRAFPVETEPVPIAGLSGLSELPRAPLTTYEASHDSFLDLKAAAERVQQAASQGEQS